MGTKMKGKQASSLTDSFLIIHFAQFPLFSSREYTHTTLVIADTKAAPTLYVVGQ